MDIGEWLMSDDTGTSSKTIVAALNGLAPLRYADVPHDPDDFGRCYRLLLLFPEYRERLPEVARRHPKWGPMIDAWDELTSMYERFCDGDGHYRFHVNRPAIEAMSRRIHELEDLGFEADGWKRVNLGWEKSRTNDLPNPFVTGGSP